MLGYLREKMGKQILITGTNSYVGTSFKQYIEKKMETCRWKTDGMLHLFL